MSDMVKIREWVDSDDPEPEDGWEWPHPPYCVESRVQGDLRSRVLTKLGRPVDDPCEIRLIERDCEGGWSEFTAESWFDLEVWVHEGRQAQRVWETTDQWNQENGLAALLKWTDVPR